MSRKKGNITYSIYPGIGHYNIYFRLCSPVADHEVYMSIFGSNDYQDKGGALLINMWGRDDDLLNISWFDQKMPPFVRDFMDKEGRLAIFHTDRETVPEKIDDDEIMTFDEFRQYLAEHSKQGSVKCIEVE